jgi:hypothetical protein
VLGEYILGNIDEDGYLRRELEKTLLTTWLSSERKPPREELERFLR